MLNDTYIRNLKATDKEQKHFDGGGLYLSVAKTGSKLWRMAYRFEGKTKLLSFGAYPTVSLKDARKRREDARRLLSQGIDPGAHKKQLRETKLSAKRDTFKNIALEWHSGQTTNFTDKHLNTIMFRLKTYLFPPLGSMHIAKMEPQDILGVIKPIEQKGQNETARRLLQLMGQIFRYAVVTGRTKHNIVADKVTHRAAMTDPKKSGPFCVTLIIMKGIILFAVLFALLRWYLLVLQSFGLQHGMSLTLKRLNGAFLPSV